MTTRFQTGTVSVTLNSTEVVGVGTKWLTALLEAGDKLTISGGRQYDISKVIDDTHLSLSIPFAEATAATQAYAIERNFNTATLQSLAKQTAQIGEVISGVLASGSAVSLTTATAKTVTSINLPAGEWDIEGVVDFLPAGTTSITQLSHGVSETADTLGGQDTFGQLSIAANVPGANVIALPTPESRISLAAPATIYLIAKATFTVSTMTAYGSIVARSVRKSAT